MRDKQGVSVMGSVSASIHHILNLTVNVKICHIFFRAQLGMNLSCIVCSLLDE